MTWLIAWGSIIESTTAVDPVHHQVPVVDHPEGRAGGDTRGGYRDSRGGYIGARGGYIGGRGGYIGGREDIEIPGVDIEIPGSDIEIAEADLEVARMDLEIISDKPRFLPTLTLLSTW